MPHPYGITIRLTQHDSYLRTRGRSCRLLPGPAQSRWRTRPRKRAMAISGCPFMAHRSLRARASATSRSVVRPPALRAALHLKQAHVNPRPAPPRWQARLQTPKKALRCHPRAHLRRRHRVEAGRASGTSATDARAVLVAYDAGSAAARLCHGRTGRSLPRLFLSHSVRRSCAR